MIEFLKRCSTKKTSTAKEVVEKKHNTDLLKHLYSYDVLAFVDFVYWRHGVYFGHYEIVKINSLSLTSQETFVNIDVTYSMYGIPDCSTILTRDKTYVQKYVIECW